MLAKLSPGEAASEVNASMARLQTELAAPVIAMSYPVGGHNAFDDGVVEAVRNAGFGIACSYISGTSRARPESRYALRRLPIERHMDQAWFEAVLALPEVFLHPARELLD
jgi:hypothetical protein